MVDIISDFIVFYRPFGYTSRSNTLSKNPSAEIFYFSSFLVTAFCSINNVNANITNKNSR